LGNQALPVVNGFIDPLGYSYAFSDASTASSMMSQVSYDVGVLKRAPILGVWMEKLPSRRAERHRRDVRLRGPPDRVRRACAGHGRLERLSTTRTTTAPRRRPARGRPPGGIAVLPRTAGG
jgi:hypothetical protein